MRYCLCWCVCVRVRMLVVVTVLVLVIVSGVLRGECADGVVYVQGFVQYSSWFRCFRGLQCMRIVVHSCRLYATSPCA